MSDMEIAAALEAWRLAWKAVLDTSEAYNSRLIAVRAERERGNWDRDVTEEYRAMNLAQQAEFPARERLYAALSMPAGK